MKEDGHNQQSLLFAISSTIFETKYITQGQRNPNSFKELWMLNDNDRWLLCSEGRGELMKWLVLTPKQVL